MSRKTYIGIDNGVTGSIAVISDDTPVFIKTPVRTQQNYTKTKQSITRVDVDKLREQLGPYRGQNTIALIERPMINPGRFKATTSALRSLEATLIVVEELGIPHQYIDSKEWQKKMLPSGLQKEELKTASLDIGNRLFPMFSGVKHPDRDSLLIAEYAKRSQL